MQRFGESLGDPVADEILRDLRQSPEGLTRTQMRERFQRNKSSAEITRALAVLETNNLAIGLTSHNTDSEK